MPLRRGGLSQPVLKGTHDRSSYSFMNKARSSRLTKAHWIRTGLAALSADGPSALQAEPLARRLGTTKGSFYWHFADLPAFHVAIIAQWEEMAISQVVDALAPEHTDVGKLRRFAQVIADKSEGDAADTPIEPAIRAWALSHKEAAAAVARVDSKRMSYLAELLTEIGVTNPEMGRIIYGASLGMEALAPTEAAKNAGAMGSLVDLVLALR